MKNTLICAVLAIRLLGFSGPAKQEAPPNRNEQKGQKGNKDAKAALPGIPTDSGGDAQRNGPEKEKAGSDKSIKIVSSVQISTHSEKDTYDKALVWATILLVAAAFFQILFLWRTVQATKTNSDALISSERAWLVVQPETLTPKIQIHGEDVWMEGFSMRAINTGRTPARIISARGKYITLESLSKLPEIPNYEGCDLGINRIVVPYAEGEPRNLYVIELMKEDNIIKRSIFESMERGKSVCYAYGIMTYVDAFQKERKTAFGYQCHLTPRNSDNVPGEVLKPNHFRVSGPSAYNEYT
jgi:hypothetical protein